MVADLFAYNADKLELATFFAAIFMYVLAGGTDLAA